MADIAFPASPVNDQTHTEGGRTWQYDSALNAWLVVGEAAGILTTADRIDEDDMVSDSATKVPTQQSVRAYVDATAAPVASVNAKTGAVTIHPDDLDDALTANKFVTAADLSKLDGIEAGADQTDATNVAAAGAVMATSTITKINGPITQAAYDAIGTPAADTLYVIVG